MNRDRIIDALREAGSGGLSRIELSAAVGIHPSNIDRYIAQLRAEKLVGRIFHRTEEGARLYIRTFFVLGLKRDGPRPKPFTSCEQSRRYRVRMQTLASSANVFNLAVSQRAALRMFQRRMTPVNSQVSD